jgi:hypothetical protein
VVDKSKREDGIFSREDFSFDKEHNVYICPAGKVLITTGKRRHCRLPQQNLPKADIARRNKTRLFDHLVGAAGQGQRDSDAECLGGLQVDVQLHFRGLLNRKVGRLVALENPPGINSG